MAIGKVLHSDIGLAKNRLTPELESQQQKEDEEESSKSIAQDTHGQRTPQLNLERHNQQTMHKSYV